MICQHVPFPIESSREARQQLEATSVALGRQMNDLVAGSRPASSPCLCALTLARQHFSLLFSARRSPSPLPWVRARCLHWHTHNSFSGDCLNLEEYKIMFPHIEETGTLRKKGVRMTKHGVFVEGQLYYAILYNRFGHPQISVSISGPLFYRDAKTSSLLCTKEQLYQGCELAKKPECNSYKNVLAGKSRNLNTLFCCCWALGSSCISVSASLVAQIVKNLPAIQETWIWSLGWEDPLEKWMATHSSILAWRTLWTEELGCSLWGREE